MDTTLALTQPEFGIMKINAQTFFYALMILELNMTQRMMLTTYFMRYKNITNSQWIGMAKIIVVLL